VGESAVGGSIQYARLDGSNARAELTFLDAPTIADPMEPPAAAGADEEAAAEEAAPDDDDDEKRDNKKKKEPRDDPANYIVAPPPEGETPESAPIPKFSRRQVFYDSVVRDHPLLARAFVNRLWAHFFGRGIVHPIDKLDSAHPPSHPALLDWLAADFRHSGFDVKRLVRELVLTRTYQLAGTMPEGAERPLAQSFACAQEKPLSAEVLARSLLVATGNAEPTERLDTDELGSRVRGLFPDLFPEVYSATVKQALFLSNNATLHTLLAPAPGNTSWRLLEAPDPQAAGIAAFTAVFCRAPSAAELARAADFLRGRQGRREDGVRDLLWALLASAEFQFNH
jgi:hypothetical protein